LRLFPNSRIVFGRRLESGCVAVGRLEGGVQLQDKLLGGHLVQVLGYEIEEEEVADLLAVAQPGLRDDVRDLVARDSPSPGLDHGSADACGQEDGAAVGHEETGDGGEEDEPEPEEDVDLLVDDVERQHAQPVVTLHRPAWSVL